MNYSIIIKNINYEEIYDLSINLENAITILNFKLEQYEKNANLYTKILNIV